MGSFLNLLRGGPLLPQLLERSTQLSSKLETTEAGRAIVMRKEGIRLLLHGDMSICATLYLWLQIPNYSVTKASYTTGLAACYGLLAARGYQWLGRTPWVRAGLFAGLAAWAVCAYVTFFAFG